MRLTDRQLRSVRLVGTLVLVLGLVAGLFAEILVAGVAGSRIATIGIRVAMFSAALTTIVSAAIESRSSRSREDTPSAMR